MNTINIPTIPANWLDSSPLVLEGNGYRTHVKKVLRKVEGYQSFVIHTAGVYNGEWEYSNGRYFSTEDAARIAFNKIK